MNLKYTIQVAIRCWQNIAMNKTSTSHNKSLHQAQTAFLKFAFATLTIAITRSSRENFRWRPAIEGFQASFSHKSPNFAICANLFHSVRPGE